MTATTTLAQIISTYTDEELTELSDGIGITPRLLKSIANNNYTPTLKIATSISQKLHKPLEKIFNDFDSESSNSI